MRRRSLGAAASLAAALSTCSWGAALAEEPQRLAAEPAAIVPLAGEHRLVVERIQGRILVRAGKAGELRYMSLREEDRKAAVLEVWREGRELRLRSPEEDAAGRRRVEIGVPEDFDLVLRLEDSEVQVSQVRDVSLAGRKLEFSVSRASGTVELETGASRGQVGIVSGDIVLRLDDTALTVQGAAGEIYGHAAGGEISVETAGGPLDLDLQRTRFGAEAVASVVRLRASEGDVRLEQIQAGAELSLSGAPLRLADCRGSLDIETDAEVRFQDCDAAIHINSWGGDLIGAGNEGLVEIRTDNARVALERISGPVRVQGEGLQVDLRGIGGEVIVLAQASNVHVASVAAPVHIENDFGEVRVESVSGKLQIVSRDGEVAAEQVKAPVLISADGENVTVSWASLRTQEKSTIVNERGDVVVHLPREVRCYLEARTRFGRIETDLPMVRVSQDGSRAWGPVNRGRRPLVLVEAAGDVRLLGSSRKPAQGS